MTFTMMLIQKQFFWIWLKNKWINTRMNEYLHWSRKVQSALYCYYERLRLNIWKNFKDKRVYDRNLLSREILQWRFLRIFKIWNIIIILRVINQDGLGGWGAHFPFLGFYDRVLTYKRWVFCFRIFFSEFLSAGHEMEFGALNVCFP